MIDTPGYDDYIGEVIAALHTVDTGIILLHAQNGIEVVTEIAWDYAEKDNKPIIFVVNKLGYSSPVQVPWP